MQWISFCLYVLAQAILLQVLLNTSKNNGSENGIDTWNALLRWTFFRILSEKDAPMIYSYKLFNMHQKSFISSILFCIWSMKENGSTKVVNIIIYFKIKWQKLLFRTSRRNLIDNYADYRVLIIYRLGLLFMVSKLFWDYALNDELKCIKYNFMHFAFGNLHSSSSEKN